MRGQNNPPSDQGQNLRLHSTKAISVTVGWEGLFICSAAFANPV